MVRHSALSQRTFIALCSLLLLLCVSAGPAEAGVPPRVLAFYYAWFDADTWQPQVVPDMPAQRYASTDPAAITRQVQQAKNAGIDAFVVSWIGSNFPTDANFRLVLNASQSAGFAATVDFEAQRFGSREAIQQALAYVRDSYMGHPAFLREGGKPVLFFWRQQVLPASAWAEIRQAVDPQHRQVWIAEGVDISYQQVFDGHHLYSIAWSPNPAATLADWSGRVRRAGPDKLWVATVMPGYDDTRTDRSDRFARARENGAFYRLTWQAALNSGADWVVITSFNEWVEGSMIEPSVSYGNLYLDLTREWAARFKSGERPAPAVPLPGVGEGRGSEGGPAPAGPASAGPTSPTRTPAKGVPVQATDTLRVRLGPGPEYPALGRVVEGDRVTVLARSEDGRYVQIAMPDILYRLFGREKGWVLAEYLVPQDGLEKLPVVVALPVAPSPPVEAPPEPESLPPEGPPSERIDVAEY